MVLWLRSKIDIEVEKGSQTRQTTENQRKVGGRRQTTKMYCGRTMTGLIIPDLGSHRGLRGSSCQRVERDLE